MDATATAQVTRSHPDKRTRFAFFVKPEETGATLVVDFFGRSNPHQDLHRIDEQQVRKENIDEGYVFHPETRGSQTVEIRVTNDGSAPVTVKADARKYYI